MGARRNAAEGAREETRGWLEERKEGGRGQGGRLCRLFVLCRVAAISHTSSAASGLASELTPSSLPTSPATHPGDPCHPLGGNSTNPGISYGETNESEAEKEKQREEGGGERARESRRGLACCDFQRSPLPSLGRYAHEFYGDAFDFLKGIGSDGYPGTDGARVCLGIFLDVISA